MLLGRTHDDDDDLLHDILKLSASSENGGRFFDHEIEALHHHWGTDRRLGLPPVNQHGERKCYNCNVYGHIARDCPEPKRPLKCQRCQASDHTQRNCKALLRNESNDVREALPCTEAGHRRRDAASRWFRNRLIYTVWQQERASDKKPRSLQGNGQHRRRYRSEEFLYLIVPDEAQSIDLLVGRTFTDPPFVIYAKVRSTFRFFRLNDCPFSDLVPSEPQNLERRFVNVYWTKRIPTNRLMIDGTTLHGFMKLAKSYMRARLQNIPHIRRKLSRNIVDLSSSGKFCQWLSIASLTYVVK
ncbi:hypothetical protein HPB52_005447 [Rhipicephalus sanguineus]|uniref:CCHC-type domain-containing protein n=1 Tax=Rhipicephalus sanguineus TaxID=34632 RepID=A0A9D4Q4R9_RHISA|nr:hypothetical protein HPB52_005447 [Rhipicephalus sanguineus]